MKFLPLLLLLTACAVGPLIVIETVQIPPEALALMAP